MARDEKKYEILPGVAIPDLKTIMSAASDFSNEGVADLNIRDPHKVEHHKPMMEAASGEDIEKLKRLGEAVAEEEERSAAESKRRMEAIMGAVVTPESISDLRKSATERMTDEQREEMKRLEAEEAAKKAEEEAKIKAREERRMQQQKALEESLARKAAKAEEEARIEAEKKAKLEAEEKARKEQERLEAKKKAKEEAQKRAAERANEKNEPDDEYKAWVKAKREAALAEAAEKEAQKKAAEEAKKAAEESKKVAEESKTEEEAKDNEETPEVVVEPAEVEIKDEPQSNESETEDPLKNIPVDGDSALDDFSEFL